MWKFKLSTCAWLNLKIYLDLHGSLNFHRGQGFIFKKTLTCVEVSHLLNKMHIFWQFMPKYGQVMLSYVKIWQSYAKIWQSYVKIWQSCTLLYQDKAIYCQIWPRYAKSCLVISGMGRICWDMPRITSPIIGPEFWTFSGQSSKQFYLILDYFELKFNVIGKFWLTCI